METQFSGLAADQATHRFYRLFDRGKSSVLHDLQNPVHALIHDFGSGLAEEDLTLAHDLGNWKIFFLAESKDFFCIFKIHEMFPPFPYIWTTMTSWMLVFW